MGRTIAVALDTRRISVWPSAAAIRCGYSIKRDAQEVESFVRGWGHSDDRFLICVPPARDRFGPVSLFIPLTVIEGVYGMNFDPMPELHWRWGYAAVWGLMITVTLGLLAWFGRRGWLGVLRPRPKDETTA